MADSERWNERYAAKELIWSAGPNALFAEVVGKLKPGKALDLACGEGRNAIWLAEQGWQVTGIDFSSVGIDKARQIAARRGVSVDFLVEDLATAELAEAQYDLVAVVFLHNAPEQRAVWMAKAIDAVAPGGSFVFIGHDPENIHRGVGGPQDPAVLQSAADVCGALLASPAPFDVVRAGIFERQVGSDPGHGGPGDGTAIDTIVHAIRQSVPGR